MDWKIGDGGYLGEGAGRKISPSDEILFDTATGMKESSNWEVRVC